MDPVSIVALVLSIIAILLWLYTFFFQARLPANKARQERPNTPLEAEPPKQDIQTMPDVMKRESQLKILEQQVQWESRFMAETQKFSQMVRKNLEMLNTRVGIKFDVKPISDDFKKKPNGPEFVDSMDVSDANRDEFDADTPE